MEEEFDGEVGIWLGGGRLGAEGEVMGKLRERKGTRWMGLGELKAYCWRIQHFDLFASILYTFFCYLSSAIYDQRRHFHILPQCDKHHLYMYRFFLRDDEQDW